MPNERLRPDGRVFYLTGPKWQQAPAATLDLRIWWASVAMGTNAGNDGVDDMRRCHCRVCRFTRSTRHTVEVELFGYLRAIRYHSPARVSAGEKAALSQSLAESLFAHRNMLRPGYLLGHSIADGRIQE